MGCRGQNAAVKPIWVAIRSYSLNPHARCILLVFDPYQWCEAAYAQGAKSAGKSDRSAIVDPATWIKEQPAVCLEMGIARLQYEGRSAYLAIDIRLQAGVLVLDVCPPEAQLASAMA